MANEKRLIDANALVKIAEKRCGVVNIKHIDECPTVDAVKWIPVTERLPDESIPSQHYLCWYKGRVRILKYWRTQKYFLSNGRVANVTHWMPLPEPPKGG